MSTETDILDHMLEGCQIISFDWRYLYINAAAARHGRRTPDELLGRTMMEMYPGIEGTPTYTLLQRCLQERVSSDVENEFTFPDGTTGWFELRIYPVPEGAFVLSIDITARKRAEQENEKQLMRLKSLRAIDLAILSASDLQLALKVVLEEALSELKVDAATVFLFNPDTVALEVAATMGFRGSAMERLRLRLGEGVAGRAALERRTIILPNLVESASIAVLPQTLIGEEGAKAVCVVPLISKGRLIGVLRIVNRAPLNPDQEWVDFLEALAGQAAMAIDSVQIFDALQASNVELGVAYENTLVGWSRALDLRDKETEGHTLRVTEMTLKLARLAGLTEAELVHVRRGVLLHDIGKMAIPDSILLKPDKLTEEEWRLMRQHPVYAYELLQPIPYLGPALEIPYCHHEKWDGSGYPRGLRGERIPLTARLFAVVDVYDALRSDRPYRPSWPEDKVRAHICASAGAHFDPRAVELFLLMLSEGEQIHPDKITV